MKGFKPQTLCYDRQFHQYTERTETRLNEDFEFCYESKCGDCGVISRAKYSSPDYQNLLRKIATKYGIFEVLSLDRSD